MIFKNNSFIFILILICVSVSFGEEKSRPRDYNEEYTETRRLPPVPVASTPIVDTLDIKDRQEISTLDIKINENKTSNVTKTFKLRPFVKVPVEFEHPECAKCLGEKYMKHYYAKGCKPVEGEIICNKPCPKYFVCPKKEVKTLSSGCKYKGRVYELNEEVPVNNPCKRNCFCEKFVNLDNISVPKITCANVDCFGDFSLPDPNSNCYRFYEFGKCCSSRKECLSDEELENTDKCLYDGKHYRLGERIYPKENPCIECICNNDWNQRNPLNSTACRKIECDFDLDDNSRAGCIPIYSEKSCCPVEYHCPPPEAHHCLFDSQKYRIGQKLNTGNNRTECICRVPPDFTCIHRTRPSVAVELQPLPVLHLKPNKTNRSQQRISSEFQRPAQPILNTEGVAQTLPIKETITSELLRPAPQQPRVKPHKCPLHIPGGLSCSGFNCSTILDSNGCQACSCEKPCPELECNDPCYVFAVTPGECPRCKCP